MLIYLYLEKMIIIVRDGIKVDDINPPKLRNKSRNKWF